MVIRVPSGITEGSTATVPQPTGSPVAVVPPLEYPVATTVSVPPGPGVATGTLELVLGVLAWVGIAALVATDAWAWARMREICALFKCRRSASVET